jgi:hypothetical protein
VWELIFPAVVRQSKSKTFCCTRRDIRRIFFPFDEKANEKFTLNEDFFFFVCGAPYFSQNHWNDDVGGINSMRNASVFAHCCQFSLQTTTTAKKKKKFLIQIDFLLFCYRYYGGIENFFIFLRIFRFILSFFLGVSLEKSSSLNGGGEEEEGDEKSRLIRRRRKCRRL